MIAAFFKIFKSTFLVIKKEPVILVPYMFFYICISITFQWIDIKEEVWFFALLEWLIPVLIIHPLVILVAISVIQKKVINIEKIIELISKSAITLFLTSLLYQPLYLIGALKLSKFTVDETFLIESIPKSEIYSILLFLLIGILMATLLVYFYPIYFTTNRKEATTLTAVIKRSIALFLKFKWITIMFIIYFFLTFMMGKLFILPFILAITPNYIHDVFIHVFNGVERTFFYIFILRLYLYLKPLTNLDYS